MSLLNIVYNLRYISSYYLAIFLIVSNSTETHSTLIGYEQAWLTMHPPPPKTIEGGFIFFA